MGAQGRGVHPADDGGAGRCANGSRRDRVLIKQGLFRKSVEVGSAGVIVAVTSEVWSVVLGGEPEDVGALARCSHERAEPGSQKQETEREETAKHGEGK